MADERKLHVFKTDVDWVVAYDAEDARAVLTAHYGGDTLVDALGYEPIIDRCVDDRLMAIDLSDDDGGKPRKTMREWADTEGRGFLCSTEY